MRKPLPFVGESQKVVDASNRRVGFSLQNPSSVDVWYLIDTAGGSEQRTLDTLGGGSVPIAGGLLPGGAVPPPIVIVPWFANGKVFARGVAAGAQIEVQIWDVDLPCS